VPERKPSEPACSCCAPGARSEAIGYPTETTATRTPKGANISPYFAEHPPSITPSSPRADRLVGDVAQRVWAGPVGFTLVYSLLTQLRGSRACGAAELG